MTVTKVLRSAVIALALVPAVAQAASNAAPARAVSATSAAQSLSLATPLRAGAQKGKSSHILAGLLLPILLGAAVVTGVVVAATNNSNSG